MINSKMWLVVQPTIGIPLFLGGVAVGSFAVHLAIVSNTSWVGDFLSGKEMGSTQTASIEAQVQPASAPLADAKVYPTSSDEMIVVLPDGRMGKAVLKTPLALGSSPSTD